MKIKNYVCAFSLFASSISLCMHESRFSIEDALKTMLLPEQVTVLESMNTEQKELMGMVVAMVMQDATTAHLQTHEQILFALKACKGKNSPACAIIQEVADAFVGHIAQIYVAKAHPADTQQAKPPYNARSPQYSPSPATQDNTHTSDLKRRLEQFKQTSQK